ncbi:MAG: hypothetical protein ACOZNI_08525 [Myxococcota bacterium]
MFWILIGCESGVTPPEGDGEYHVLWSTDPDPPQTGVHNELTLQVIGPDGLPVEDLQSYHGAFLHTFVVPKDLSGFDHVHHEDADDVDADDLREATFHLSAEFSKGGASLLDFEFAHQNEYLQQIDTVEVSGSPGQASAPVEDDATERTTRDVVATFTWDVPPEAGQEAIWHVSLSDTDGDDVTDVVQWGEADAHVQMVDWEATVFLHTHAWYEGMEGTKPGHDMPHLYDGPDIPFRYVFPAAGRYRTWMQVARAGAPDDEYTFAFDVEVPE